MKNLKKITLTLILCILWGAARSQQYSVSGSLFEIPKDIYAKEEVISKDIFDKLQILEKERLARLQDIYKGVKDDSYILKELQSKLYYRRILMEKDISEKVAALLKNYLSAYVLPYYLKHSILLNNGGLLYRTKDLLQELYDEFPEASKNSKNGKLIKKNLDIWNLDLNEDLTLSGNADMDYEKLDNLILFERANSLLIGQDGKRISEVERRLRMESLAIKYRDFGWKLWNTYPDDIRRYNWFWLTIVNHTVNYWKNIETGSLAFVSRPKAGKNYSSAVDWETLKAWQEAYPEMRKQYFINFKGTKADLADKEATIAVTELKNFISLSSNAEYLKHTGREKIDMMELERLFIRATDRLSEQIKGEKNLFPHMGIIGFRRVSSFLTMLRMNFNGKEAAFGIHDHELLEMYRRFVKGNYNYCLTELSKNMVTLLALKKEPFQLKSTASDGREIDLDKMRGKVILVDFWATSCTSCIARMPAIKELYDKYKKQGFEVISACLNVGDETERIKSIHEKVGADWPLILVGALNKADFQNSKGSEIFRKYGLRGVPQLFLLNKRGKLEMYNGLLLNGDFESVVQKLLAEKI